MLGLLSIFLFNFFLHVFCNSTKTSANSSGVCFHVYCKVKGLVERASETRQDHSCADRQTSFKGRELVFFYK